LLKTEITQKVKLVHSLNTHQDAVAKQSLVAIPGQRSGLAKPSSLSGNHRSRTSAVMFGLALSMGISSFPSNYPGIVANATESARTTSSQPDLSQPATGSDRYVQQLRNDVAIMRTQSAQQPALLIAQAEPARSYPLSVANRTNINNLQFPGEVSVPISVPAPKTRTFKAVATTQPYYQPHEGEGELFHPGDSVPSNRTSETNIGFSWPAAGTLTSKYGRRWGRMHKGIDIAGPVGTPIIAAAEGTVIVSGWSSGGYGNLVEIRHSDGTTTRYGHNSRLSVGVGQIVRQGQQVAEMGSTGRSTGSHVHFEIRPGGGDAVNPIAHLPANS
jgi:murein DD-endopeptidase MepM/ murein hydrolase activator NlpD